MPFTRSTSLWVNSSATRSCTKRRSTEMQSWPLLENIARSAPSTARSTSASSSTTIAFLPPSSIELGTSRSAACDATWRPTSVLPVNITYSTLSISSGPSSDPEPVITCISPAGSPASSRTATPQRALKGVLLSALSTTPLPAARAGRESLMERVRG